MVKRRQGTDWAAARQGALFLGGLLGVAHETLIYNGERPALLFLFAAMMGLAAFLRTNGRGSE